MHGSSPNMEAVLCFVASVGLELLGTSFFAAWPARYCLFHWIEPSCIKIYRVESSNLDVWLQSISHCIIFALCLTLTLCLPCNLRNRTILAAIVDVATASCQVLGALPNLYMSRCLKFGSVWLKQICARRQPSSQKAL